MGSKWLYLALILAGFWIMRAVAAAAAQEEVRRQRERMRRQARQMAREIREGAKRNA